MVWITGDIEGRVIFDLDPETAVRVASKMAGAKLPESDAWCAKPLRIRQPGDWQCSHVR